MEMQRISPSKIIIKSDSGHLYNIRLRGEDKTTVECSCPGFINRRNCKHIEFVKDELEKVEGKKLRIRAIKDPYFFIEPYKKQFAEKLGVSDDK